VDEANYIREPITDRGYAAEISRSTSPWAPVDPSPVDGPAGAGGSLVATKDTSLDVALRLRRAVVADDADCAGAVDADCAGEVSPTRPSGGVFGIVSESSALLVGDNVGDNPGLGKRQSETTRALRVIDPGSPSHRPGLSESSTRALRVIDPGSPSHQSSADDSPRHQRF
jgi:hypothetical protein